MSYIQICNRSGFKTTVLSHNEINGKVGNSIVLSPLPLSPKPWADGHQNWHEWRRRNWK